MDLETATVTWDAGGRGAGTEEVAGGHPVLTGGGGLAPGVIPQEGRDIEELDEL